MRIKIISILLLLNTCVFAQFIPNKGQWRKDILFKSAVNNGQLFFEQDRLTYHFMHPEDAEKMHGHAARIAKDDSVMRYHAFQMVFLDAEKNSKAVGEIESIDKYNYFLGKDTANWVSGISAVQKIKYSQLYKGIDFLFYKSTVGLKYDFVVHPSANAALIKFSYLGLDNVFIQNNELHLKLSFSEIVELKPYAYQEIAGQKIEVPCSFVLRDGVVSFALGNYDHSKDLVIDPQLIFSTYSGSTADNFGYTATYDDDGNLYAGGTVFDIGYPTTLGAYDVSFNSNPKSGNAWVWDPYFGWVFAGFGNSDVAITKYDATGTQRIYSTYIGGDLCEVPHSLVVNTKGELLIYGTTGSRNFPVTPTAYDTSFAGGTLANLSRGIDVNYALGSDIFIAKLSADGSQLPASTFFGGTGNDGLNIFLDYNYADQMRGEIIVDENDKILIATCSYSAGLATAGSFQNAINGTADGVVARFSDDLTTLDWASYLGGSSRDGIYSIVLDSKNDLIVAGGTASNNLNTTAGVVFPTYQGNPSDGFIGKISKDGSTLNALTYFGTAVYDQTYFVKVDRNDFVYVYGQSESMDSTLVKNAQYYSINSGMYVSKLSSDLKSFVWSTTFGSGDGKVNLSPTAFMVDLCNKVYLTGWGSDQLGFALIPNYLKDPGGSIGYNGARGTAGLTVTPDAFQSTTDGSDFYILVLEDDASAVSYASFFGGNLSAEHVDGGTSRFDRKGKIYQSMCAGCGSNSDMPIFPANAVSPTNNSSNCNNGVFKMDFLIPNVIADFKSNTVCASQSFQFNNTSLLQQNTSFYWDFGDGNTSTAFEPNHTYAASGTYSVKLKLTDPTACNLADSIVKTVKVQAYKADDYGSDTICEGESTLINFTPSKSYNSYLWVPGKYLSDSTILHPISTPAKSIDYTLVGDDGVCKDTMFYNIIVIPSLGFLNATVDNDSLVKGQSTTLHVTPSTWAVNWSPSSSLNDYTLVNPIATPPQSTMYTVTLAQSNLNCASSDSVFVFVYDVQCNEKDVYVPNIFTPNGDGKNDMLYVRGNNIKELYFTIYDRWGEKMFETTDQHVGWDGVYKGMTSDPAVFVYYLKVRCAGEKEFFIKGNITVMR
jgi:gliding motility-associated-like protein